MSSQFIEISYLCGALLFIWALKALSSMKEARLGNIVGASGMFIALVGTFLLPGHENKIYMLATLIAGGIVGVIIAKKIAMTAMPQLVAAFHSLVGLAAVLVAYSAKLNPENFNIGISGAIPSGALVEMSLGAAIGAVTFSGSIVAFAKLQGLIGGKPMKFAGQQYLCIAMLIAIIGLIWLVAVNESTALFNLLVFLSLLIGLLVILPVGGADMPVVVSMLNSYSGFAAAGIGFTLGNIVLIITGALVGSSGAILSYIMCHAMNRSLVKVIFGAFLQSKQNSKDGELGERFTKNTSNEDAAYLLQSASSVIIVPGYGMAVAQSQHAIKEMVDLLEKMDVQVRFAIHPVAGRMPGHMNVLLAEANIDYDKVLELEEINRDFASTDVVLVIGANDITNPAAKTDPDSPIYGMPILEVEKAKTVLFVKRSMAAGYAGIENELFYYDNTLMLFGDAKKVVEAIVKKLNENN